MNILGFSTCIILPFLTSIFFRLGGTGKDGRFLPHMAQGCPLADKRWRTLGICLLVGLFRWNWMYIATYFLALNLFSYGDNYWIRKVFGRNICWFIYGFMLGLASLSWINAIFGGIFFLVIMIASNDGYQTEPMGMTKYLDHAYVELSTGFFLFFIHVAQAMVIICKSF